MKTIAIINQKGGVAKTTTALAIGAGLANKKRRVLMIDLDPQGNLTYSLGADNTGKNANVHSALTAGEGAEGEILGAVQEITPKMGLLAGSPELAGADAEIKETGREYRLRDALKIIGAQRGFDFAVIDTPPALGILTVNALTAANCCIIPTRPDIYSLQGIGQLYKTIRLVKKHCNKSLNVSGILITCWSARTNISKDVAKMIEDAAVTFNAPVFKARISDCTAIRESAAARKPVVDYAPSSRAASDYMELVSEILKGRKP
jgi:chromosome partitioning protein